jgi:hypothetical protein
VHDRGGKPERRLVEHHEIRLAHQAAPDCQHLLFAALQLPVLTRYAPQPVKPVDAITPIDPLP